MNKLTYGTLPDAMAFMKAFNNEVPGWFYHMQLNRADTAMFDELGLSLPRQFNGDYGKVGGMFDRPQLYALCEALVARYQDACDDTDCDGACEHTNQADWAGEFCSSILTTLGFEWV